MNRIRVLVVEDSLTIRKHIVEVLAAHEDLEVIAEAADGRAAIELCRDLRPDVITMDMMLPVMTGLAATEYIMAYFATPILIVSASTNRGELFKTYDALAAGALDVLEKPRGGEADAAWEQELVHAVRLVSRIKVISHPRAKLAAARPRLAPVAEGPGARANGVRAVAIGASTGGPGAVLEVLRGLPATFPLPILLVIHISEPFGQALAEWLDSQLPLRVRYPVDGEPLPEPGHGVVLIAPPERHLLIDGGRVRLDDGPELHSCRPSVDVLFASLARELGPRALGCLLTGMGKDGAQGLLAMRRAGALTVAQDEASSVVFGMPGEAVRLGAATHILPPDEIGQLIARTCRLEPQRGEPRGAR